MSRSLAFLSILLVALSAQAAPATAFLDAAGYSRGICVVAGATNHELALDVAKSSQFLVYIALPDAAAVDKARAAAAEAGLGLQRLVVEQDKSPLAGFADGIVDVIIAADAGAVSGLNLDATFKALRPKGRLVAPKSADNLAAKLKAAGNWTVSTSGDLLVAEKPEPEGMDDWSHWERGPDNNPVSQDKLIKAPYRTQWLGLPYYIAMPAITTVAGGRTFVAMGHIAHHEREEAWLNTILARNGYNGAELWRRRVPDGYLMHRGAFVATDDTFYMIDPDNAGCILLDPETGREKSRIAVPGSGNEWKWIALQGDILYALGGEQRDPAETTVVRSQIPAWSWNELSKGYYAEPQVPWGFGETLLAYDLKAGKVLWSRRGPSPVDSRALALGDGRLYYYSPDSRLGCLNAATGEPVWVNEDAGMRELINEPGQGLTSTPGFKTTCYCVYTPVGLFFEAQTQMNLVAVSKDDGHVLWHHRKTTSNPNIIYVDGKLYSGIGPEGDTCELDPGTGEVKRNLGFRKRSCARLTATADSLFCRGYPEGVTRYDRATETIMFDGSMRPACNDGVIGANGLLYIGPWLCDCNLSIMGTAALTSAPKAIVARPTDERLEIAAKDCAEFAVSKNDWPMYRGNEKHNGASAANVSGPLEPLWTWKPPASGATTAPVTAGAMVFADGEDGMVRAIDVVDGNERWHYQTAGPIMQPPTIWNGRAYVGSGDGWVYCLEAATGRLLWRFDASPVSRRMPVYGYLCSTWPVNSGVLVHDGVAYFAAGIVDYDGTYLYALDAETGAVKWANDSSGWINEKLRKGISAQGNLTVADGRLYMAGGNVISPAAYDLKTGAYLGAPPKDGSPESNRGEEIGVLGDKYLVFGGRLRYSAYENVVNPGMFSIKRESGVDLKVSMGQTAPAWDDKLFVYTQDRLSPPAAFASEKTLEWVSKPGAALPPLLWRSGQFKECKTLALALSSNAAIAICETPRDRDFRPRYRLIAFDREQGKLMFERDLPGAPRQNALAIDADGRVLVTLLDGRVCCYGGSDALQAYLENLASTAGSGNAREEAVKRIMAGLNDIHNEKERDIVISRLEKMGVDVFAEPLKKGCICTWHVLGPAPIDAPAPVDNINVAAPLELDGKKFEWQLYRTAHETGMVNLVGIFGEQANVCAYAYAEFELPEARDILLKLGSNDGYICWFNGEKAGSFDGGRIYRVDEESLKVSGRQGKNTVLMKVVQQAGAWGYGMRITDLDGKAVVMGMEK